MAKLSPAARQLAAKLLDDIEAHAVDQGMTQEQVAANMGVSPARVSQLFSGPANLTVETITRLASAVGLRVTIKLNEGELEES